MHYDVIVSGGGPIGCAVARDIAGAGFSTLVLEEHRRIGYPVQCAGIVSPRTLDLAGVSPAVVLQPLRGMRVHSPLHTTLELAGRRTYAQVIDRSLFDRELSGQARKAGAEIRCGMRVRDISRSADGVRVTAGSNGAEEEFTCRLLIGADGQSSLVAQRCKLAGPVEKVPMYAAEVELSGLSQPLMEVFLGRSVAPGWFGWVVPAGEGRARVGTGVSTLVRGKRDGFPRPKMVFDALQERHPDLFENMRVLRSTGGLVPIGFRSKTYAERVMLVGDAACQVKPVSGGGLYFGLKGAAFCARVAIGALHKNRLGEADLSGYQRYWEADMGEEIRCGLKHRQVFLGFSDRDMEFLLRFLNKPSWQRTILHHGDIDHPSRVAEKLSLAGPWAEKFAPVGLGWLIRGCSTLAGI